MVTNDKQQKQQEELNKTQQQLIDFRSQIEDEQNLLFSQI